MSEKKKVKLTLGQHEIKRTYTEKKPICVDGFPDAHSVWLKSGCQSFMLDGYKETAEEAEWMRDMLAKALDAFNEENQHE